MEITRVLGVLVALAAAAAHAGPKMPLRQVERTILIPPGSWAANQFGFAQYSRHYDRDYISYAGLLGAIVPLPPEYTTKSGWNFPLIIIPVYVRKAVVEEKDTSGGVYALKGANLVLGGGILGAYYSVRDNFTADLGIEVIFKRKVSHLVWYAWNISTALDTKTRFTASVDGSLGHQTFSKIGESVSAGASLYNNLGSPTVHFAGEGSLTLYFNLNPFFGFSTSASASVGENAWGLEFDYLLNVYW